MEVSLVLLRNTLEIVLIPFSAELLRAGLKQPFEVQAQMMPLKRSRSVKLATL